MVSELPLKSVVLFIASGTLVFIIVFIFAKRQITRFALKSRGPHQPIGEDASKAMKQEIERRLKRTMDIKYEPKLLRKSTGSTEEMLNTNLNADSCHFLYRMKAMDALYILDEELHRYSVNIERQKSGFSLRSLLLELRQDGPLAGLDVSVVEKFIGAYDHARHDPEEFLLPQYQEYMGLLDQIMKHIKCRAEDKKKSDMSADASSIEEIGSDDAVAAMVTRETNNDTVKYRPLDKRMIPVTDLHEKSPQKAIDKSETIL